MAALADIVIEIVAMSLLSSFTPIDLWLPEESGLWGLEISTAAGSFVLFLVLHGYFLVMRGQTLGKMLLRIRIARPDGTAASPGRLIGLRYGLPALFGLVPAIGLAFTLIDSLFIFRASHRCLHDSFADTVVLRTSRGTGSGPA